MQDILNLRGFAEGKDFWQLVGRGVRMLDPDDPDLLEIVRKNAGDEAVQTFRQRCRSVYPHANAPEESERNYTHATIFEPDHLYYRHQVFTNDRLGAHVSKVRGVDSAAAS
jgi:hypothetical protein